MSKKKKTLQLTEEQMKKRNKLIHTVLACVQIMVKSVVHGCYDEAAAFLCRKLLFHLMECKNGRICLNNELVGTPYMVKEVSL